MSGFIAKGGGKVGPERDQRQIRTMSRSPCLLPQTLEGQTDVQKQDITGWKKKRKSGKVIKGDSSPKKRAREGASP